MARILFFLRFDHVVGSSGSFSLKTTMSYSGESLVGVRERSVGLKVESSSGISCFVGSRGARRTETRRIHLHNIPSVEEN